MSYTEYNDNGTIFYLCWNCGRIHIEEIETQQCEVNYDFVNKCLDKKAKKQAGK
jgi:hypothetical protein